MVRVRQHVRIAGMAATRPVRGALALLYALLVLTLDLHHNHGAELPPRQPAWDHPHATEDPCPVQVFQNAHGDPPLAPGLISFLPSREPGALPGETPPPRLPGRRPASRGPPPSLSA